jgi:nucleoporin p58/p45
MSFSFGTSQPSTGFGFGTPAAAPAPAPAPTATSAFSFGTPGAPAPATAAGAFGAAVTPGFGLGGAVGSTPATSTGFGFGAPAGTAFSLAAPPVATSVTSTMAGGFGGFGASAAAAATSTAGAFNLGAPGTKPATVGFGFGAPAAAATSAAVAPLNFNTYAATPASGGFGAAATTAPGGFAGFGGGTLGTASVTTTSSSLAFGAPPTTLVPGTALGVGLGGTSAAPPPAFGALSSTPASTGYSQGLGGTSNPALAGAAAQNTIGDGGKGGLAKTIKETMVPQQLSQNMEDFKKFVKEEKSVSSEIAHISSKTHHQIKNDIDGLSGLVKALSHGLAKNRAQLDWLKMAAAQELLNVEIAQRTKDTPPAMQYENVAPYDYFSRMVLNFENQMLIYKRQIEETEQHLQTAANRQNISPDDIMKAIQRLQTSFTNLAGRFQKIHEAVKQQKEQYIQLHR